MSLDDSSPAEYTENYFGLAHALERLFQRRVDLMTERSVRDPYFRQVIEATLQAPTFDQLHAEVVLARVNADFVDRDDVRMVELGGGFGFAHRWQAEYQS